MSDSSSSTSESMDRLVEQVCRQGTVTPETMRAIMEVAVEIAREGREGHQVGTIFVVGDEDAVMQRSRPMILDPLLRHEDAVKQIGDPDIRETVKELAQLDGGFVVTRDGIVRSGARYFNASSEGIDLPLGLGSRHMAGASITRETQAIAVVVSESSVVRVFQDGEFLTEIIPELWMFRQQDHPSKKRYNADGPLAE